MQIVIDKESLIKLLKVSFFIISGADYKETGEVVNELLDKVGYVELPKGHWINANEKITALLYDDQYEEYKEEEMTIAEYLDGYTDEGCPVSIIEANEER